MAIFGLSVMKAKQRLIKQLHIYMTILYIILAIAIIICILKRYIILLALVVIAVRICIYWSSKIKKELNTIKEKE